MNTSSYDVSQVAARELGGPPKKQPAGVRKPCGVENVVSIRSQELLDDITNLSRSELRRKYRREANSHRNSKSRCKTLGYIWHPEFECFKDFLLHIGRCPGEGYTLDRIDSSDPEYAPGKVRWASKAAQTYNRQNTRYLTNSQGETLSVSEWSRRSGKPAKRIAERVLRLGWTVDEATTIPVGRKRPRPPVTAHPGKARPHHSSSTPLVSVWSQLLADVHGQAFLSFTAAEKKMLKDVANRFESEGLSATEVLTSLLTHWTKYTRYSKDNYGAFGQIPTVPTIQFLMKYCNAAGNFFLQKQQEEADAALKQAEREKLNREAEERQRALMQKQADLKAIPEYLKLQSVLMELDRTDRYHAEQFVTPKMREYIEQTYREKYLSEDRTKFIAPSDLDLIRAVRFLLKQELEILVAAHDTGETYEPSPILEVI